MRNLLNPKWIFVINTIPLAILFFLFIGQFNIIHSLLTEDNIRLWKCFGTALGLLIFLNLGYGAYLILKRKKISFLYGFVLLLTHIPFIYIYGCYVEDMIDFNVPQWMVQSNLFMYPGTFLMPTLVYSLFILVLHFTPAHKEHKAWINILLSASVPLTWYLFSQLLLPFWQIVESNFSVHTLIIFVIAGTLLFLFFLVRSIFIVAGKKADVWKKYSLAWKIPISLVLPLVGLCVNNGHFISRFNFGNSGILGDFSNHWFYILAVINGVLICLPGNENKLYRLLLFIGRSITLTFTFYFFIVLLPFLPLSVIAIVAVGLGFLMLAPLLLFVVHINELSKDFIFLKNHFSRARLWAFALAGIAVIPVFITGTYIHDKKVLSQTLDYVYNPDYSKSYSIDKESLRKTLAVVKSHKEGRGEVFANGLIPYLSTYFNWLVLDNLTLSEAKLDKIEEVFYNKPRVIRSQGIVGNEEVDISNVSVQSTFDKTQNAWLSWVNLELTNNSERGLSEYSATIDLPTGCWISDYYLFVGDRKEMGILAEKKAAMWIFSQIRNVNRDPGILHYLTGNKVAFRVFPFAGKEVRKTGIQFIHKEPVKLSIGNRSIELGNSSETLANMNVDNPEITYLSTKEKQNLKKVQRKPYYHFLVDVSQAALRDKEHFTMCIDTLLAANKELAGNAKISFVNSYVNTCAVNGDWKKEYDMQKFDGGFFVERAIKTTLYNAYRAQDNTYPVIVVVTGDFSKTIIDQDFSDFKMAFPESPVYFSLDRQAKLNPHSFLGSSQQPLPDSLGKTYNHVLKYEFNGNVMYLPDNGQPDIVLKNEFLEVKERDIKEKSWNSALLMQGKWMSQVLHPETSDKEWLELVKCSFMSKIMTPVTSYLVVENEAQKAMLKKKQEQVLAGNKALDLEEETQRMSEPGLIITAALLMAYLLYYQKRKKRLLIL